MEELSHCPRCNEQLKRSSFGLGNRLIEARLVNAFNVAFHEDHSHSCDKCCGGRIPEADGRLLLEADKLKKVIAKDIECVPVLSIEQPFGWEYQSLCIVTSQSTTGTGLISELTSAWTDLFGMQSKRYNSKIATGENLCKASLRLQALGLGGNAVIGVDVDYAEVGGQRAMLMVCMSGTAINLANADTHWPNISNKQSQLRIDVDRLEKVEEARSLLAS